MFAENRSLLYLNRDHNSILLPKYLATLFSLITHIIFCNIVLSICIFF